MGRILMATILFPIFVIEGLDIVAFNSIEAAEQFLEPWWVKEKLGKVYDSEGRLLELIAEDSTVKISSSEEIPMHISELRKVLFDFLKITRNDQCFDPNHELSYLVKEVLKIIK